MTFVRWVAASLFVLWLASAPAAAGTCGNGAIEDGESCDDGNLFAGDCCAPNCTTEESYLGCAGKCLCDTCGDQLDNDEDGLVDAEDPECATLHRLQRVSLAADQGRVMLPPEAVDDDSDGLACLGGQLLTPSAVLPDRQLCGAAQSIAAAESASVARVPGAPLLELITSPQQRELELSFDAGTSVLAVDRIALANATRLRLHGSADSTVVVQIHGALALGAGVRIELEGGLRSERVLWNATGSAGAVTIGDNALLPGTLLAPTREVTLGCGAKVAGGLYGARVESADAHSACGS